MYIIHTKNIGVFLYPWITTYEITCWLGAEIKTIVLKEDDFIVIKPIKKTKIGFKNEEET
jgi:hypothetical protein